MGYCEAENVYAAYRYLKDTIQENTILIYGFSMGAVASMKALADYEMEVKAVMLQAPYATLEGTIGARVAQTGLPEQPLAKLFTFWMGVINDFDSGDAQPIRDAEKIEMPALLVCGLQDPHIPQEETEAIFDAIGSSHKTLQFFEHSKHENLLNKEADLWKITVSKLLEDLEQSHSSNLN